MATQWTAGLVDGTPLPAATLNTIGAAWETYAPTITQNVNVPVTAGGYSKYARINKNVFFSIFILANGNGTAANEVRVSLPIAAAAASSQPIGQGFIYDASAANLYLVTARIATTTTMIFFINQLATGAQFGLVPNIALAATDQISICGFYEAA